MKNTLGFIAALILIWGCMNKGLKALEYEYEKTPPMPIEFLADMCERGEDSACEAYADLFFTQEEQTK